MKSEVSQGQLKTKRRVQDVLVVDSDPRTGEAFRAGAAKAWSRCVSRKAWSRHRWK